MRHHNTIQVFEHEYLAIDARKFFHKHWEKLGWYNDQHGGAYFSLLPKGVKFKSFVGVIQVDDLTIEILPKIGSTSDESSKAVWQQVLIDMLRVCNWMQVHANDHASLQFKPNSILEAYIELFINQCERLFHLGLVKKYRRESGNTKALKGKLLFNKHIQSNLVHKERFYTEHQVYDFDNLYNQILLKALHIIPNIISSPVLIDRVYSLILAFPELKHINITPDTFRKIVYDRKTTHYKQALEIAAMLLLNYRPDITTGRNHVLAILFDMNELWEEYVYRQLIRAGNNNWDIHAQNSSSFWQLSNSVYWKKIRPDIVINSKIREQCFVIDTKWKLPDRNIPSDADLKQMFVYNQYWKGNHALLVYPHQDHTVVPIYYEGQFHPRHNETDRQFCGIVKISVLDGGQKKLDTSLGSKIFTFIENC